jgi:hypothetical protein
MVRTGFLNPAIEGDPLHPPHGAKTRKIYDVDYGRKEI